MSAQDIQLGLRAELHMRKDRISFLSWKEDKIVFWWEITRAGQRGQSACWLSISSSCSECFPEHPTACGVFALSTHYGAVTGKEKSSSGLPLSVFSQLKPDLFYHLSQLPVQTCWVMGGQDADLGNAGPELRTAPFETMTPIPSPLRKAGCSHWSKMVLLNLQYWPFSSSP